MVLLNEAGFLIIGGERAEYFHVWLYDKLFAKLCKLKNPMWNGVMV